MVHKQQSAARASAVRSLSRSTVKSAKSISLPTPAPLTEAVLADIRGRRLALEAKLEQIEMELSALRKQHETLQDEQLVRQARRRVRYPEIN